MDEYIKSKSTSQRLQVNIHEITNTNSINVQIMLQWDN